MLDRGFVGAMMFRVVGYQGSIPCGDPLLGNGCWQRYGFDVLEIFNVYVFLL